MMSATLLTSIWFLVTFQFERVLHSDVNIALRDPASRSALFEIRNLPGVDYAEPIFTIACDMRNGRFARRMGVIGLAEPHTLSTPMQTREKELQIPPEGIVLSKKLAEILHLRTGDRFELVPVRGRRNPISTFVADVSESYLGLDAHARADYVARLVGESFAVSSVDMLVNPAQQDDLFRAVKQIPAVQGLSVRLDSIGIVQRTFVKTISMIHSILIFFAGMIAFGSILNNALVEIGDRMREVSTFRVLGYEPREIAGVFFRQSLIVFSVGLIFGFPISYALVLIIVSNTPTELVRLPIVRNPFILSAAAALASIFVLIAQAVVYRHLKKLDWLEGIKVKE
jgi:putative ABC transport system permease protein